MDKLKDLAGGATGGGGDQQQGGGGGGGGMEDKVLNQGVNKELGGLGVPSGADGAIDKEVNQEAGKFT